MGSCLQLLAQLLYLCALLQQLWELKQGMAAQQQEASMELLMHFLHSSR